MKAKLTKDFTWYGDGINAEVIPAGSVVGSPIAENAVDSKHGTEVDEKTPVTYGETAEKEEKAEKEDEKKEKAHNSAPLNKSKGKGK